MRMKKLFLHIPLVLALLACVPAMSHAAIEIIEQEQLQAVSIMQVTSNTLRITNANGQVLHVYNVAGTIVKSFKVEGPDRTYDLNLPKGVYIVKVGKTARRINVK